MINWCVTNYAVRGSRKDLSALTKMLNRLNCDDNVPFKKVYLELGLTLQDIIETLGLDIKGIFSPDPYVKCPFSKSMERENKTFSIDFDGILRMSTITEWNRKYMMEALLKKKFPSLEFFWYSSENLTNFHQYHDPEDLCRLFPYRIEGQKFIKYRKNEKKKFVSDLKQLCKGIKVPDKVDEIDSVKFRNEFNDWKRRNADTEDYNFIIYKKWNFHSFCEYVNQVGSTSHKNV